jgi:hypothetical protein
MRPLLILALVALSSVAQAQETKCPANRAVYVREDGEKFVVRRYGEVHAQGRVSAVVQEGTFQGRQVLNGIDSSAGSGIPFSSFKGEDPQWERRIVWKRRTDLEASDIAPAFMTDGPLGGSWTTHCQDAAASAGAALPRDKGARK